MLKWPSRWSQIVWPALPLIDFFPAVTPNTTMSWIRDYLAQDGYYALATSDVTFTVGRRQASYLDTMKSLGLGEIVFHLRVDRRVPGGAPGRRDPGTSRSYFSFVLIPIS